VRKLDRARAHGWQGSNLRPPGGNVSGSWAPEVSDSLRKTGHPPNARKAALAKFTPATRELGLVTDLRSPADSKRSARALGPRPADGKFQIAWRKAA